MKIELKNLNGALVTVTSIGKRPASSGNFESECLKAVASHAKGSRRASLLLKNDVESAAMLGVFLAVKKPIDVYFLTFKGIAEPVLSGWKRKLAKLKIKTNQIEFDFANEEHLTSLEKIFLKYECVNLESLLEIWIREKAKKPLIAAGNFCSPEVDRAGINQRWKLPGVEGLGLLKYCKKSGGEPFFFLSTSGLCHAQIQSEVTAGLKKLYADGRTMDRFALAETFAGQLGFYQPQKWRSLPQPTASSALALRASSRSLKERVSVIANRIRGLPHKGVENITDLPQDSHATRLSAEVFKEMHSRSVSLTVSGAVLSAPDAEIGSETLAVFPMLMTTHVCSLNMPKTLQQLKKQTLVFDGCKSQNLKLAQIGLAELEAFFRECIGRHFDRRSWAYEKFEITQCWALDVSGSSTMPLQGHTNSMISGLFYLGDSCDMILFAKAGYENVMVRPVESGENLWNSQTVKIVPKAGKLFLFPSNLNFIPGVSLVKEEGALALSFKVFIRGEVGDMNAGSWLRI